MLKDPKTLIIPKDTSSSEKTNNDSSIISLVVDNDKDGITKRIYDRNNDDKVNDIIVSDSLDHMLSQCSTITEVINETNNIIIKHHTEFNVLVVDGTILSI